MAERLSPSRIDRWWLLRANDVEAKSCRPTMMLGPECGFEDRIGSDGELPFDPNGYASDESRGGMDVNPTTDKSEEWSVTQRGKVDADPVAQAHGLRAK